MESQNDSENESARSTGPLPAPLEPGTVIEGKYRIERIIGRGGMGVVAAATHLDLDEPVALKFLQVPQTDSPDDFRARFALEARVCAKLRNEHIARVHDVGEWMGQTPFMVMDLIEGVDLRRILRDEKRLGINRAVGLVVQICEGLAEAHAQGIVHRDLKPPNIFITKRSDGSELVKVLDFGISKWAEELGELTATGVMLGSPKYMSPEQLNGSIVDGRADVWSIGAILYGMLTGRPPYDFANVAQTFMAIATGAPPPPPSSIDPTISAPIEAVILRCLQHDRAKRIANVSELAGELLRAVESPFASETQARLASVLDPVAAMSIRSSSPLSSTTGSYNAAFAVGTTGAFRPVVAGHVPSALPAPTDGQTRTKRWLFAGAVAAAFALTALLGATATNVGAGAAGSAMAVRTQKAFAPKRMVPEHATEFVPVRTADAEKVLVVPMRRAGSVRVTPKPVAATVASAPTPATNAATPQKPAAPAANPLEDRQ